MREELRQALMLIEKECMGSDCSSCQIRGDNKSCPLRQTVLPFSWDIPELEAEAKAKSESSIDPCKECKYEDVSSHIEPCLSCHNRGWGYGLFNDNFEPKKKHYIPFDLSKKEVRDKLRGKWIVHKKRASEIMIHDFWVSEGAHTWFCAGFNGKDLLKSFTFLDGSPCGEDFEK